MRIRLGSSRGRWEFFDSDRPRPPWRNWAHCLSIGDGGLVSALMSQPNTKNAKWCASWRTMLLCDHNTSMSGMALVVTGNLNADGPIGGTSVENCPSSCLAGEQDYPMRRHWRSRGAKFLLCMMATSVLRSEWACCWDESYFAPNEHAAETSPLVVAVCLDCHAELASAAAHRKLNQFRRLQQVSSYLRVAEQGTGSRWGLIVDELGVVKHQGWSAGSLCVGATRCA